MIFNFEVENIKCAGCASNIKNHLQGDHRINNIEVDIEKGLVEIDAETDASDEWLKIMTELGYPKK
ncbi:MAG: heavy-metal-associated domain-containing protein [Gammaproteobacteria bacterium]|nr:heavy-metal-associated domain-containing protein [Gammaproteobacteria bacterium]MCW8910413.1 heavy-metal-associated domain-containing protein [Gammaproteobacteria bacterium]MCW9005586.1 heavy-metal-associated domain-containing protein [Gammaproteobacteria bacterium]